MWTFRLADVERNNDANRVIVILSFDTWTGAVRSPSNVFSRYSNDSQNKRPSCSEDVHVSEIRITFIEIRAHRSVVFMLLRHT